MPESNPFFPENLDVLEAEEAKEPVAKVHSEPGLTVWHSQDHEFKKPKVHARAVLRTTDLFYKEGVETNPVEVAFTQVWENVIGEYLREFSYTAEMANLESWVSVEED